MNYNKKSNLQDIKIQLKGIINTLKQKGQWDNVLNGDTLKNIKTIHEKHKKQDIKDIEKHLEGIVRINATINQIDLLNPMRETDKNIVSGSAFFITDTYLLSSYHVVNSAIKIEIKVLDKRYDIKIISFCEALDIVLLKVLGYHSKHYFELDNSDFIKMNDVVYTYGYPLGSNSIKITAGIVSGFEDDKIQIDAPINPGNSGGPLFNHRGKIIGINTSIIRFANNIGYATQINYCKNIFIIDNVNDEIPNLERGQINTNIFKYLNKYVLPKYFHFECVPIPTQILDTNSELEGGVIITKILDIRKLTMITEGPSDTMSINTKLQYIHSPIKKTLLKEIKPLREMVSQIHMNEEIDERDIITRVGEYHIDRLGMCYKTNNPNRKIPFESLLNNFRENVIPIELWKHTGFSYTKQEYLYTILDITNIFPIRYRYERLINTDITSIENEIFEYDGIIIQELNLNHIKYIFENQLFLDLSTYFINLIQYLNIDNWYEPILFISYINEESDKALLKNIVKGDIITHINETKCSTLKRLKKEIKRIKENGDKYFYLKTKTTNIYFN
jgi:hypothetical protein